MSDDPCPRPNSETKSIETDPKQYVPTAESQILSVQNVSIHNDITKGYVIPLRSCQCKTRSAAKSHTNRVSSESYMQVQSYISSKEAEIDHATVDRVSRCSSLSYIQPNYITPKGHVSRQRLHARDKEWLVPTDEVVQFCNIKWTWYIHNILLIVSLGFGLFSTVTCVYILRQPYMRQTSDRAPFTAASLMSDLQPSNTTEKANVETNLTPTSTKQINMARTQPASSVPITKPPKTEFADRLPISAFLQTGTYNKPINHNNSRITQWTSITDHGTHLEGITLSNDSLVVPSNGIYFVYSQVGFDIPNDIRNEEPNSLFHYVIRYNDISPNSYDILLSSFITASTTDKSGLIFRYTSYVGASLKLTKGDKIYVNVSDIERVRETDSRTYFGMFLIK